MMDARSQIKTDEGLRLKSYPDPLTGGEPWTCGYGCTGSDIGPQTEWTQEQAESRFESKFSEAEMQCQAHFSPWFNLLNEPRQAVLINMAYQMGMPRLLGFAKALAAVRDGRWHDALGQMLDSAWAKQTPKRAMRLARQMEDGTWQ